jgi:hypothetical protein
VQRHYHLKTTPNNLFVPKEIFHKYFSQRVFINGRHNDFDDKLKNSIARYNIFVHGNRNTPQRRRKMGQKNAKGTK